MAKEDGTTSKAAPAKATPAKTPEADVATPKDTGTAAVKVAPAPEAKPEPAREAKADPRVSTCVVNDGRGQHVGNAVNGKVCSYHAMHYDRNGNQR